MIGQPANRVCIRDGESGADLPVCPGQAGRPAPPTLEMQASGATWRASIPAKYTDSPYPLQYYFEFHEGPAKACLYPGFAPDLLNQPYFVVRAV